MMFTWRWRLLALALVLMGGACRQPDGPIPTPSANEKNEIGDIARDMVNIANKDPQGAEDLTHDIGRYAPSDEAAEQSAELAQRLTTVLAGARLDDPTAQRLAHSLWIALTAKEISQQQVAALQEEVKSVLAAANVPAGNTQPVADQLAEVQKAITTNPKRWYQVF